MKVYLYNKSSNPIPEYATIGSAGVDLHADLSSEMVIEPGKRALVPTGIHLELPHGIEAQIRGRSGLAIKKGVGLANGIGTIDSDYRGEIKVILINWGDEPFVIHHGDRIAQMVFAKYEQPEFVEVKSLEALSETERGEGGFGHSGV